MGKLKALIGLLLVAVLFYSLWKWIPVKMNNADFQDGLDDIARRVSYTGTSDDDIKQMVIAKGRTLEIPLKEDQITVTHGTTGLGITVRYHIHYDLVVQLPWLADTDITANSLNKRI